MNFNPQPIEPKLNNMGKYQKYTLKKMAANNWVVRIVMYHTNNGKQYIQLFDESKDRMISRMEQSDLAAMGKRGIFIQEVFCRGVNVSIVKFRLKEDVRKYFIG